MEKNIQFRPICLDLNMPNLVMNNTFITLLNMLQTVIGTLPMNTTSITTLNANTMRLEKLSVENLIIELVPSYWTIVILVMTITCMSLGTLMLFVKLVTMYKKYRAGKYYEYK